MDRYCRQACNDVIAPGAGCAGQCQQDVAHRAALHQIPDPVRRVHRDTVDAASGLGRIVVDEAHQNELARVGNCGSGLYPRIAGAVDQQAPPCRGVRAAPASQPESRHQPAAAHQQEEYQRLQDTQTAGQEFRAA